MTKRKKIRKITTGMVFNWIFSVLFLLVGLILLLGGLMGLEFELLIIGIIFSLGSLLLFPPFEKWIGKKFHLEWSMGVKWLIIIIVIITSSITVEIFNDNKVEQKVIEKEIQQEKNVSIDEHKQLEKQIISTNFWSDFGNLLCNDDETGLKKDALFNEKFKGKYVTWRGNVAAVRKYNDLYYLRVKHCPESSYYDINIEMRDDQRNKLLNLKNEDRITYTAKLIIFSDLVEELEAIDGVISFDNDWDTSKHLINKKQTRTTKYGDSFEFTVKYAGFDDNNYYRVDFEVKNVGSEEDYFQPKHITILDSNGNRHDISDDYGVSSESETILSGVTKKGYWLFRDVPKNSGTGTFTFEIGYSDKKKFSFSVPLK